MRGVWVSQSVGAGAPSTVLEAEEFDERGLLETVCSDVTPPATGGEESR